MLDYKWPMIEVLEIKRLWPVSLWDIRNDTALAEWLISEKSPLIIPDELVESAREFHGKNSFIKASLFFRGGWQKAEWFIKTCNDFKLAKAGDLPDYSIEEAFIRICPELIGGDTWNFLGLSGSPEKRSAA